MSVHPLKVAIALDGRPAYQIAAAAKINPSALSKIANGKLQPTDAVKARISSELGREPSALFSAEAVAELVAASRAAQGLPEMVTNPNVLDQVAAIITSSGDAR